MKELIFRLTPWETMVLQDILYRALEAKVAQVKAEPRAEGVTEEEHAWWVGSWEKLDEKVIDAFLARAAVR